MPSDCRIMPGPTAASFAASYWDRLAPKLQRAVLFDIPFERRREKLAAAFANASQVCFVAGACGWLIPMGQGSATAACHFIMPPDSWRNQCETGAIFMREAARLYDCLFCLVPLIYSGVLRLLDALGFERNTIMPGACHLALRNRCADAALCIWMKK